MHDWCEMALRLAQLVTCTAYCTECLA
jgi:hypothetical protein